MSDCRIRSGLYAGKFADVTRGIPSAFVAVNRFGHGYLASEFHADTHEKFGLHGIVDQAALSVIHAEASVFCFQENVAREIDANCAAGGPSDWTGPVSFSERVLLAGAGVTGFSTGAGAAARKVETSARLVRETTSRRESMA
jgi:hypothetical protein